MLKIVFHTHSANQEIILHTLFESGITRVGDLERYIQDDVVRYGGRLSELGKKLDNAYQEIVRSVTSPLPCFFAHSLTNRRTMAASSTTTLSSAMRSREKTILSLWVGLPTCLGKISLAFASSVSPQSSGYRISLSRRNFYARKEREWAQGVLYRTLNHCSCHLCSPTHPRYSYLPCRSKPMEPPPPFPPPPAFVPLESTRMEDEIIGLLRPYYKSRFEVLAAQPKPPLPTAGGSIAIGGPSTLQTTPAIPGQLLQLPIHFPTLPQSIVQQPTRPQSPAALLLPDDAPSLAQTKMGPLGQIAGGKSTNASSKKKPKKEKDPAPPGTSGGGGVPGVVNGLVGGTMNGVINMNVGGGGGVQQMTVAASQPGNVGGTIGVMQASTMTQAGTPGQPGAASEAQIVVKKRGGPGRGKKGKMDLASRVVIATAS